MKSIHILFTLILTLKMGMAQNITVKGYAKNRNEAIPFASILLKELNKGYSCDVNGFFEIKELKKGKYTLIISALGYITERKQINITDNLNLDFFLKEDEKQLNEVVISGTLREVSKLESPVPIEIYNKNFFKSNPCPSIFESLQNINGIRPQVNCNICNTGDIHVNGLEGPYTMVLIDGMPIVSGLSTVYGLMGIPRSIIERVEIIKGPASTLYGSEAIGGLINVITIKSENAALFSSDIYSSDWRDANADLSFKLKLNSKTDILSGINYFNFQNPTDRNNDGFTDMTQQHRIALFNKWTIKRENQKIFNIAGRYVYEDRWGGQTNWNSSFRGSDSIYAESIYTNRAELFGIYQLPTRENIFLTFSGNTHKQNSYYGTTSFMATQSIGFIQLYWNKTYRKSDFLSGVNYRHTFYDDHTPVTETVTVNNIIKNKPSIISLPGMFIQNEYSINNYNKLLTGIRYDYNSIHGNIFSPRINYKLSSKDKRNILRLGFGNGYRIANVFSEDHAALTGAREVIFREKLKPERSWNANTNFVKKIYFPGEHYMGIDFTAFYTYFTNRIIPDYETHANKIFYQNLKEHSVSKGISLIIDFELNNSFKGNIGSTLMDVYYTENGLRKRQLLTEQISGVWNLGYTFKNLNLSIDYNGNLYGPMLLPLLGEMDNRAPQSPYFSLQNIQLTYKINSFEIYTGLKNILDFTPPANSIARAFDPYDKQVLFDTKGNAIATPNNPNALTFDPTYVYAPNQGRRFFIGIRLTIK
jgi:outer membrane receptor for ferrienterochelin and colicins